MKFLRANAPALSLDRIRQLARANFDLAGDAQPLHSERDQNTLFREQDGMGWVMKVANRDEDPWVIEGQLEALSHIHRTDPSLPVPKPRLTREGRKTVRIGTDEGEEHVIYALSYLEGRVAAGIEWRPRLLHRVGIMHARLGKALRGFFHAAAGGRELLWDLRMAPRHLELASVLEDLVQQQLAKDTLVNFVGCVAPRLEALRAQVIHGDLNEYNLIVTAKEEIAGLIDFGDMIHAPLIFDVAGALCEFMTAPDRIPGVLTDLLRGYHEVTPLEPDEQALLFDLVEARLVIAMLIAAYRRTRTPQEPNYFAASGAGAVEVFRALHELTRAGFDSMVRRSCSPGATRGAPSCSAEELLVRRKRVLGSRACLFYDRPLHIVRGEGVWLIDETGRRFLDCYNNVPIVGHCHPQVVAAIAGQSAILNTNTRYLSEQLLDYAERLSAKTGGELTACAFVNSGSEANDIAWRIATEWTGARGALVQEFAYHGITEAIHAVSPSTNRSGAGASHVRTIPPPDRYRGLYPTESAETGPRFAEFADSAIVSLGRAGLKPAAYFVDAAFMTNGVLEPLPNYVAEVFRRVRAAGGLCIADEVQAGFGRMGRHFWGYQHHGVIPDIITVGKPAGNGHPIGVVMTRPEILDHFIESTGFFSTFGGNNVSCAAGSAVLDVIDANDLVDRASDLGAYFKSGLGVLMDRHDIVGDVRATGLAIGLELVTDRQSRLPAAAETNRLINLLREEGVLVGSEGVGANVVKIRPPLVVQREHIDVALSAFESALQAL
jgi:4-aminobutyrate aminotransferase-like enzyme/Ser/Thr protein kinase RdoA (MazF antagonist)